MRRSPFDDTHREFTLGANLALAVRLLRNAGATKAQLLSFRARVRSAKSDEAAYDLIARATYSPGAFPEPVKTPASARVELEP